MVVAPRQLRLACHALDDGGCACKASTVLAPPDDNGSMGNGSHLSSGSSVRRPMTPHVVGGAADAHPVVAIIGGGGGALEDDTATSTSHVLDTGRYAVTTAQHHAVVLDMVLTATGSDSGTGSSSSGAGGGGGGGSSGGVGGGGGGRGRSPSGYDPTREDDVYGAGDAAPVPLDSPHAAVPPLAAVTSLAYRWAAIGVGGRELDVVEGTRQ